ncbi:SLATT domain-containing protein [Sporosarcina sp. D27]|uniref:SLATT domain-containing protein n=1 Tax=Sporosarcina sp. D27 TaxID=1382305 RepID=UPI000470663C|nr:SLATT domain-containing protein [Sporosarcina sp. D27]
MKDYTKISINSEVNKKINSLDKTRENRIEMSKRLKKYNDQWQFVFFFLNIEAVIFVVLSLVFNSDVNIDVNHQFGMYSSLFAIYVILLQYYVSNLNYNERSLKLHYHQLDIEDLILKLKGIMLNISESKQSNELSTLEERFSAVMYKYQLLLKSNENHKSIDNKVAIYKKNNRNKNVNKSPVDFEANKNNNESDEERVCNSSSENEKKPIDYSLDNIFLKINMIVVVMFILVMMKFL